jgi:hypothetical protein
VLRIEKVEIVDVNVNPRGERKGKDGGEKQAYRLWLGDGELLLQGSLSLPILAHEFRMARLTDYSCVDSSYAPLRRHRRSRGRLHHCVGKV